MCPVITFAKISNYSSNKIYNCDEEDCQFWERKFPDMKESKEGECVFKTYLKRRGL